MTSALTKDRLSTLSAVYRNGLLQDTLPFWFPRSVDPEYGGYFTCLDRDGSLLQTDKAVWFQGRMAWILSTIYLEVEKRPEWLAYAQSGISFIEKHCFDRDGRMFFSVTREGAPLRKRRYQFSETFAIIAFAAYARASGDERYLDRAEALFQEIHLRHHTPGALPPKTDPNTRPMKGLAVPMIFLVTAQEVRKHRPSLFLDKVIADCLAEIERDFYKPDMGCVLEVVAPDGGFIDNLDGRCVNPGHSIEAGWFILEEARQRGNDPDLVRLGTSIIRDSLEIGWDREYGGIYYFRDAKGLPCTEYWHDMKFWWPHNEAILATLLAYELTGDPSFAE